MSYARNLARLGRAGVPAVNSLQDIRDLTIYDGLYPVGIIARGHTTPGDGGGGYFNILTGQTPSYYTDDNGVTVEFTGGDGSVAAVRKLGSDVRSSYWGMPQDGGDASDAIDAMIEFVRAKSECIEEGGCLTPRFGVVAQPYRMIIDGPIHGISRPIDLYVGMVLEWMPGCYSTAMTQGMRMVNSQTGPGTQAEYNTFGQRAIKLIRPQLDGAGLANKGIVLENVASGSKIDGPLIYNVTGTAWAGATITGDGTSTAAVSSSAGMSALDVIDVGSESDQYLITEVIDANTVILSRALPASVVAETATHRAVAIQGAMLQQTDFVSGDIRYNDIGIFMGDCRRTEVGSSYASSDVRFFGVTFDANRQACSIVDASGILFSGTTFQKSKNYEEIRLRQCRSVHFSQCWVEPTDSDTIDENGIRNVPMIYVSLSCTGIEFNGLRWTANAVGAGWRRLMKNDGEVIVRSIATNNDDLAENPSRPGEYAWIEQTSNGYVVQEYDGGQVTLDNPTEFVVDENGDPAPNCSVILQRYGGRDTYSVERLYNAPGGEYNPTLQIKVSGEDQPRMILRPATISIGDGITSPEVVLRKPRPNWEEPTGSANRITWDSDDPAFSLDNLKAVVKAIQQDLIAMGIFGP